LWTKQLLDVISGNPENPRDAALSVEKCLIILSALQATE
jgi:hypothetical protein